MRAASVRRALASHVFYLKILWFYPPRRENAFRRRAFPGSSDLPDFPAKRAAKESQKRHSFRIFALRRADFQTSRFESRRRAKRYLFPHKSGFRPPQMSCGSAKFGLPRSALLRDFSIFQKKRK